MPAVWPILSQVCLWLALLAGLAFAIGRRAKHPRCRTCGYDMTSQATGPGPWTCPECGRGHASRRQLTARKRAVWLRHAFCLFLLAWYGAGVVPRVAARGWPGAIPTWALAIATPWAHQDEDRDSSLLACNEAMDLGMPVAPRDRLFLELDTRATRQELAWPIEYLIAARTHAAYRGGSHTTYFSSVPRPRLDLNYYARGKPELRERARRALITLPASPTSPVRVPDLEAPVGIMIWHHVPQNDRVWQCQGVGDLLFVQAGSPDTAAAIRQSFEMFESLESNPRRLVLEPEADPDLSALARLRATSISMGKSEATVGQLIQVVALAAGLKISPRSSVLIAGRFSEELVVPVPAPCDGVAFLDRVLEAAAAQSGLQAGGGPDAWTLIDGEIAINDPQDEIMLASYHIGYHDLSEIIDVDTGDPLGDWDAIVDAVGGDHPLIDTAGLFEDGRLSQAWYEGAVPVPPHHVQVQTPARTHQSFSRALEALRKIGPLHLQDGRLVSKTRIKEK